MIPYPLPYPLFLIAIPPIFMPHSIHPLLVCAFIGALPPHAPSSSVPGYGIGKFEELSRILYTLRHRLARHDRSRSEYRRLDRRGLREAQRGASGWTHRLALGAY